MNASFAEIFQAVRQVVEYPLFKLGRDDLTLLSIFKFLVLVALVFLFERIFRRQVLQRLLAQTRLDASLRFAVERMGGYLFILVGLYIAFLLVGIDLGSLAVLAGAVGVGLGFGLQNIFSNFVSGLIILAERPITVGDRVEVAGVAGRVTTISLRSTTIITNDNISIIVPNSSFITESVINWSHSGTRVQLRLPISAAYGSDTEKVRTVLEDVAAAHPHVLKDPPPHVYFLGFGESSLNFELGVWTSEMMHQPRRFRSQLNFAIERAFRDNRIEIPFPQRDLHVRSAPWLPPTSAAGHSPNDSSDAGGRASAV